MSTAQADPRNNGNFGEPGHGKRMSKFAEGAKASESKAKSKSEGKAEGQIDYFRVWHE
jgi:hypothetical protein